MQLFLRVQQWWLKANFIFILALYLLDLTNISLNLHFPTRFNSMWLRSLTCSSFTFFGLFIVIACKAEFIIIFIFLFWYIGSLHVTHNGVSLDLTCHEISIHWNKWDTLYVILMVDWFMVFNITFNNISGWSLWLFILIYICKAGFQHSNF